jgi:hypothetical protein
VGLIASTLRGVDAAIPAEFVLVALFFLGQLD